MKLGNIFLMTGNIGSGKSTQTKKILEDLSKNYKITSFNEFTKLELNADILHIDVDKFSKYLLKTNYNTIKSLVKYNGIESLEEFIIMNYNTKEVKNYVFNYWPEMFIKTFKIFIEESNIKTIFFESGYEYSKNIALINSIVPLFKIHTIYFYKEIKNIIFDTLNRDNISEENLKAKLSKQNSEEEFKFLSDVIITNYDLKTFYKYYSKISKKNLK